MKCDSSKAVTFSSRKTCKSSLLPSVVEDSSPSSQSCQRQHKPAGGAISCAPKGTERKENCVSKNKSSINSLDQHVNIGWILVYFCHNFSHVSAKQLVNSQNIIFWSNLHIFKTIIFYYFSSICTNQCFAFTLKYIQMAVEWRCEAYREKL